MVNYNDNSINEENNNILMASFVSSIHASSLFLILSEINSKELIHQSSEPVLMAPVP